MLVFNASVIKKTVVSREPVEFEYGTFMISKNIICNNILQFLTQTSNNTILLYIDPTQFLIVKENVARSHGISHSIRYMEVTLCVTLSSMKLIVGEDSHRYVILNKNTLRVKN